MAHQVVLNKEFGDRELWPKSGWGRIRDEIWSKKQLLYCKNDKETRTILINRAFVRDSIFRPKCAKHTIVLHNLGHFLRWGRSSKRSWRAAAMQNEWESLYGKQSFKKEALSRWHAKKQFLSTGPQRERDFCFPSGGIHFHKVYVLKYFLEINRFDLKNAEK